MAMADVVEAIQEQLPLIAVGMGTAVVVIGGVFFYTLKRYGEGQLPPIQAILIGFLGFAFFAYMKSKNNKKTRRW